MAVILTKRSNTASSVPVAGDLTNSTGGAELAVNTADKRLFTKDSGGTVVELGTNPSSVTLPNGTANGVAYLNGSKVLTSGSALTFDGANFATTGKVTARNDITATNGSVQAVVTFGTGLGIFGTLSNDDVAFFQNNSERMRLTSTGLGIGTSSPSQRLHVTGSSSATTVGTAATIQITSSTGLSAPAGDVYLQAVIDSATAGDRGTALAFFTGRTAGIAERARIDSLGNLGLGVTPSAWSVGKAIESRNAGNAIFTNGAGEMLVTANSYYDGAWRYGATGVQAAQYICGNTNGTHIWKIAASGTAGNAISFTQAMTLDASSILKIAGRYQFLGNASNTTGDTAAFWDQSGIGPTINGYNISFQTGSTERVRIDSSGNVGIGTSSPNALLNLKKNANTTLGPEINLLNEFGNTGSASQVTFTTDAATAFIKGVVTATSASGNALVFGTAASNTTGTERARIDSNGYLLVGKTSTGTSIVGHQFSSSGVSTHVVDNANLHIWNRLTAAGTMVSIQFAGSQVGSIVTTASSTSYNTSSDYRLKNTIAPMTGALAKVAALKPCTYKWNADGSDGEGFIAHELAEVCPQAVTGEKDAVDADGNPVYQGIDTSFLAGLYAAAIQELKAEVDALKSEINTLKGI